MSEQTIRDLQEQLDAHQRHLAVLETQLAKLGSTHAPAGMIIERDEARAAITRLAAELQAHGVDVEAPPGVAPAPAAPAPPGSPQIGQAEIASIINLPGANFTGAQGINITGVQVGQRTPPKPRPDDPDA